MYGRTFGSVIDALAERFPSRLALVDGDLRWSFREIVGEIRTVGQALRTLVKALLYHSPTAEHVRRISAHADIRHVLILGSYADDEPGLDLSGCSPQAPAPADVDPEAPAWIQYTGGTTGMPKGVVHPHRTALSTLMGCALEFGLDPDERHAHVAPLTQGGFATFLPVWMRGGCNFLLRSFEVDRLIDVIESERITSTLLVPTMVTLLLDSPRLAAAEISSLRTLIYGAAPITPRMSGP